MIGWRSLQPLRLHAPVISKTVITGVRLPHVLMRQRKLQNREKNNKAAFPMDCSWQPFVRHGLPSTKKWRE